MKKPKKASNVIQGNFGKSDASRTDETPGTNVPGDDSLAAIKARNEESVAVRRGAIATIIPLRDAIQARADAPMATFHEARKTASAVLVECVRGTCEMLAEQWHLYKGCLDRDAWCDIVGHVLNESANAIDTYIRAAGKADKDPQYWTDYLQQAINDGKLPDLKRFKSMLLPPKPPKPKPDDEGDGDDEGDDEGHDPGIALDTLATLATTLGLQPDVDVDVVIAHAEALSQYVQRQAEHVKNLSVPSAPQTALLELLRGSPGSALPDIHEAVADVETILAEHAKLLVKSQALADQVETLQARDAFAEQPDESAEIKQLKKQLEEKQKELAVATIRDGGIAGIYGRLGVKSTIDVHTAIQNMQKQIDKQKKQLEVFSGGDGGVSAVLKILGETDPKKAIAAVLKKVEDSARKQKQS